ncbi:MAG: hypothetical protein ACOCQG_03910 [Candidatus Nanoarchaeia archaeon]
MDQKALASKAAIVIGFLLITAVLFLQPAPTAWVVTEPGTVARLDVSSRTGTSSWHGIYGNVSSEYETTSLYLENEVEEFNPGLIKCQGFPLYATTLEEIDWDKVLPAEPIDIDNHLAVSGDDPLSGTNVFDKKKIFKINNEKMELPTVKKKSQGGKFYTGALKQDGTLIFVTNITDKGFAFNGQPVEFQLMLPEARDEYNFFLDETASIEECNQPPVFTDFYVKDELVQEEKAYIVVEWHDLENHPVSVSTSIENSEIEYDGEDKANISWTPSALDAGYKNVTVTLTDDYGAITQKTEQIFIESVNKPPVLSAIEDIDAYIYEPYEQVISAFDYQNFNNHPRNATLEFYTSPSNSWLDIETYYNSTDKHFYGVINFTPVDSQKGKRDVDIIVSDGEKKDNQTIELSVGYCDDGRCDSRYEDCHTCPEDCGVCDPEIEKKHFAMDIKRNKTEPVTTVKTRELVKRGTCYKEGEIIRGMELCEPLAGVKISTFVLINDSWKPIDLYETNEKGLAKIQTDFNKSYKLEGEKDDFHNSTRYVGKGYFYVKEEEEPFQIKVNETEDEELVEPSVDEPRRVEMEPNYLQLWFYYGIVFSLVLALLFLIHNRFVKKEQENNTEAEED